MPHVDMIQVAPKSPTFYEPYAVFQSCHMSTWFKSLTRALYFIVRYCNMLYSSRVACRHDSSHSQEPYILSALYCIDTAPCCIPVMSHVEMIQVTQATAWCIICHRWVLSSSFFPPLFVTEESCLHVCYFLQHTVCVATDMIQVTQDTGAVFITDGWFHDFFGHSHVDMSHVIDRVLHGVVSVAAGVVSVAAQGQPHVIWVSTHLNMWVRGGEMRWLIFDK